MVVPLVLCLALPAAAQNDSFPRRILKEAIDFATSPDRKHDSTYVTRPSQRWSFSLETTLISSGAFLSSDIKRTDYTHPGSSLINGNLENRLQRHLHKKIGGSVGFGSLSLSSSFEVGSKNPGKNSFMSLAFRQPSFGGRIQYFKLHEYVDGTLVTDDMASPISFTSNYPGTMRTLTVDAYYLVNHREFTYTAATDGNYIQHRSAGSWIAIAKYMQGDMSFDPKEEFMLSFSSGLRRYTSQQVCLGAGYSYNWVPFYRVSSDVVSSKGYRNLTMFLSVIPMASLFNHVTAYSIRQDGDSSGKSKVDGSIVPVFTVRAGVNFSWDRFAVVATAGYNRFGFRGTPLSILDENKSFKTSIDSRGVFDDLTAKMSIIVRL